MRDGSRLVAAFVATRAVAVALRLFGYARTSAALSRLAHRPPSPPGDAASRLERARAVEALVARGAVAGVLPVGCLPRSLVVATILSREGIEAVVRIGVSREGDTFRAHAWAEHGGEPLGEPEGVRARFRPFDRDFRDGAALSP